MNSIARALTAFDVVVDEGDYAPNLSGLCLSFSASVDLVDVSLDCSLGYGGASRCIHCIFDNCNVGLKLEGHAVVIEGFDCILKVSDGDEWASHA